MLSTEKFDNLMKILLLPQTLGVTRCFQLCHGVVAAAVTFGTKLLLPNALILDPVIPSKPSRLIQHCHHQPIKKYNIIVLLFLITN